MTDKGLSTREVWSGNTSEVSKRSIWSLSHHRTVYIWLS